MFRASQKFAVDALATHSRRRMAIRVVVTLACTTEIAVSVARPLQIVAMQKAAMLKEVRDGRLVILSGSGAQAYHR